MSFKSRRYFRSVKFINLVICFFVFFLFLFLHVWAWFLAYEIIFVCVYRAMTTYAIGSMLTTSLCCMAGLCIYAYYSDCDPYTQGRITFRDEVSLIWYRLEKELFPKIKPCQIFCIPVNRPIITIFSRGMIRRVSLCQRFLNLAFVIQLYHVITKQIKCESTVAIWNWWPLA